MRRVEICGGIASGKTTLTSLLSNVDICSIYENFSANPFFKDFYHDPVANAFETEITFLLQHFHEIRKASTRSQLFCCDFSLTLDAAYADVTLRAAQKRAFLTVHSEGENIVGLPNLLIYLKCDPSEELRRIRRRRRKPESTITVEYLGAINAALRKRIAFRPKRVKVVEIDSGKVDFAHDRQSRARVTKVIFRALGITRFCC